MKKLFTVMLVLALALSLAACGGKDAADETEDTSELDEETLVNYLAAELSFADLADIYAQTYKEK